MEALLGLPAQVQVRRAESTTADERKVSSKESVSEGTIEGNSLASFGTALRYNPLTLCSGTFLADVVQSTSNETNLSHTSSSDSGRQRFWGAAIPSEIVESLAEDTYVFEDDMSSGSRRQRWVTSPTKQTRIKPVSSCEEWTKKNETAGRKVAHKLMRKNQSCTGTSFDGDTVSMSLSEEDMQRTSHEKSPKSQKLGQGVGEKKLFTKSPSPLDFEAKHKISSIAVKALSESSPQILLSPNTVLARNSLVEFGIWEEAIAEREKSRSEGNKANDGSNESVTNQNLTLEPTVPIRTISILARVLSIENAPNGQCRNEFDELTLYEMLDEKRKSSEEVSACLGIEEEGSVLLDHMRAKAGIIEDLSDDACPAGTIPWLYLFDELWMPHYEEYVVRAVHAYSRKLIEEGQNENTPK